MRPPPNAEPASRPRASLHFSTTRYRSTTGTALLRHLPVALLPVLLLPALAAVEPAPLVQSPQAAWQAAMAAEDHHRALDLCQEQLERQATQPAPAGIWHSYRGLSLHALGRSEEAVDSLRRGQLSGDHLFDPYFQRAYAESLIDLGLYRSAAAVVDAFIDDYPASSPTRQRFIALSLKERDRDRIDADTQARLVGWIGRSFAAERFGLTLTLAEEVLALHRRQAFADAQLIDEARLHGGTAALQLGLPDRATGWLAELDPGFAGGKAGLSLALAHILPGRVEQARSVLDRTLATDPEASIAAHCRALQRRLQP